MNKSYINIKDPKILRQVGVEALTKSLGPVGMANFFLQFDTGNGNYTKERDEINTNLTVDEICDEIRSMRNEN